MRDYTITDQLDRDCLAAAKREDDSGRGTWLPWRGMYARADRLVKMGLLKRAGIAAMPPYKLYILTDLGFEELQVAAAHGQAAEKK